MSKEHLFAQDVGKTTEEVVDALSPTIEDKPPRRIHQRPKISRSQVNVRLNSADVQKLRWLCSHFDIPITQSIRDAIRAYYSLVRGELVTRQDDDASAASPVMAMPIPGAGGGT